MKHLGGKKKKTVWKEFFFPSDTIFKKSFSTALLCSNKSLHPGTLFKRPVQFYHYKRLNFVFSTWAYIPTTFKLAPAESHLGSSFPATQPTFASAPATGAEKSLCSGLRNFLMPPFWQLIAHIPPLYLPSSAALPFVHSLPLLKA